MIKNPGSPFLTWKLSVAMAAITATVLGGGLLARPWFQQERPKKYSPTGINPQRIRPFPTPRDSHPSLPSEDGNPPPRMPRVDDPISQPQKGSNQR
jgi:hypothetical protein